VGAVRPVDHWCRDQPVAPPSERLCPCTWGTLRAQVLTILNLTQFWQKQVCLVFLRHGVYPHPYIVRHRASIRGISKDWKRRPGRPRHTWLRTTGSRLSAAQPRIGLAVRGMLVKMTTTMLHSGDVISDKSRTASCTGGRPGVAGVEVEMGRGCGLKLSTVAGDCCRRRTSFDCRHLTAHPHRKHTTR